MKIFIAQIIIHLFLVLRLDAGWIEKTVMPGPRAGMVAVELDSKIFLIGGKDQINFYASVNVYDPEQNIWDTLSVPLMPTVRSDAAAVVHDGKIYVIGGRNKQGSCKAFEVYDPRENTWTMLRSLKGSRSGLSTAVVNDSLLIFGGIDSDGFYINKIEWYDIENDQWEKLNPKLDPPRVSMFFFTFEDTLFFSGGFYFSPLNSMAKLSTLSEWQKGPQLPVSRGDGAAVVSGDSVFLIGGETSFGSTDAVDLYLFDTQEIIPGEKLPESRAGHAACVYKDTIYVFGGHGIHSSDILSSVVIYHPLISGLERRDAFNSIPHSYITMTSYPNPFNSTTAVTFNLTERDFIRLDIYDVQGCLVQNIFTGQLNSGEHRFYWDTSNIHSASGLYLAMLRTSKMIKSHKMLLIR